MTNVGRSEAFLLVRVMERKKKRRILIQSIVPYVITSDDSVKKQADAAYYQFVFVAEYCGPLYSGHPWDMSRCSD